MREWTQDEMFPVPTKYKARKSDPKWPTWRKHAGKRTSCDDCIMALANHTTIFAPEPASQVREDANGRRYYCMTHSRGRKEQDGR